jgi:hypothetical protein
MNKNTLASAFNIALTAAPRPAALLPASDRITVALSAPAIPMEKRQESVKRWTMDDDLLLTVLQQCLTPSDQLMARRTLLRPAPWEQVY